MRAPTQLISDTLYARCSGEEERGMRGRGGAGGLNGGMHSALATSDGGAEAIFGRAWRS